jgi:type II secretory pathway pseudopilin PulG
MRQHPETSSRRRGVSLLESMILVVIVGIVGVGFGVSLQSSTKLTATVDTRLETHARLVEKMEDLLSRDYTVLAANSGLSDTVSIHNVTYNRTVSVANKDADGNGGNDADFLEVTVTINGLALTTRVTQP